MLIGELIQQVKAIDWAKMAREDCWNANNEVPFWEEPERTGFRFESDEDPETPSSYYLFGEGEDETLAALREAIDEEEKEEVIQDAIALLEEVEVTYDNAFIQCEKEIARRIAETEAAALKSADKAGWRICVFGTPGTNNWDAAIAEPGKADEVMRSIYKPSSVGPYESVILKPSEAAKWKWRNGDRIFRASIREIMQILFPGE